MLQLILHCGLSALPLLQTNIAPSPIPLAPQHPAEEEENSNKDAGLGIDDDDETKSDIVLPRTNSEQRSKNNHDL